MEKIVKTKHLIGLLSAFIAVCWILLSVTTRNDSRIETDSRTRELTLNSSSLDAEADREHRFELGVEDTPAALEQGSMQDNFDYESFSAAEKLVADGYFYDISDEIFDSSFMEEFLSQLKSRLSVKETSLSSLVDASAREEMGSEWQPILDVLDLEPDTSREAASIITDALARKFELIQLWTNDEISQAQYRESEAKLVSIRDRLAAVLDESELREFSQQRQLATQLNDYDEGYYRISEEIKQGSLYPFVLGDDQANLAAHLAAGADANASRVGEPETSLLSKAISVRSEGAAILLIAHGSDVNFADSDGFTVLHQAAEMGNANLVAHLIDAGADPTAKSRMGLTPLMAARLAAVTPGKADFSDVFELLAK